MKQPKKTDSLKIDTPGFSTYSRAHVLYIILLVFCGNCFVSCNKNNFRSSSPKKSAEIPDATPAPGTEGESKGEIQFAVERKGQDSIWVATTRADLTFLKIDGDTVAETKKWSGLASKTGYRTYATETGVFIGGTGGHLFWIDSVSTPQGKINRSNGSENYFKIPKTDKDDRVCPVAYRRDRKRFLGVGYAGGLFMEVPLTDVSPFKPVWAEAKTVAASVGVGWGYSCFIDQERLVYYSVYGGSPIAALNLKTMSAVDPVSTLPNGSFVSLNAPDWTAGGKTGASYAIGGDRNGNILNGKLVYNMAHEPISDTVWISGYGAAEPGLAVVPRKCFDSHANCQGFIGLNTATLNARVSPMSALKGGYMVGLQRAGNSSRVYLMRLNEPSNITAGISMKNIHEIGGDPYMYSDFTGASLFILESETTVNLKDAKSFDEKSATSHLDFNWESSDPKDTWLDLELYVRCYASGSEKPDYQKIETVEATGKPTQLNTADCTQKKFDQVDLKIVQTNDGNSLMRVKSLKITPFQ